VKGEVTDGDLARSGAFFPLVGVVQGFIAGVAVLLFTPLLPEELVAGLVIFLLIAVNGGFHLDGLADTFDAVAVRSTGDNAADRQKRLSVMKESTAGAIGVTAIVMGILLKYLFMTALFQRYGTTSTAILFFLMPLFSKWTIIPIMLHGRAARNDGLGKIFIEGTGKGVFLGSSLIVTVVYFAVISLSGLSALLPGSLFLLLTCLLLYAYGLLWTIFCGREFGGLTGDTMGAAGEIADLLFLAIALLWL
jgi:adenosylcobinamide-GDP ribazoletransferase